MNQTGMTAQTSAWRIALALLPGLLLGAVVMVVAGPIPQPQTYHQFADAHVVLGIPHAGDVLSNIAFIVVGAWGLWLLSLSQVNKQVFIDNRERQPFWWLFTGVFLTGFGSGWYHLSPDNDSLVWDRLPMALAFMGLFSAMIAERINRSLGIALLGPLLVVGVASVLWWIWTEHQGHGDLRWYLIVQFYPMLTMVLMLLLLPTPYTHGKYYWGLFFCYTAAKVAEILDHGIHDLSHGFISGHTLKHLFAAAGVAWLLRMLWLRRARW